MFNWHNYVLFFANNGYWISLSLLTICLLDLAFVFVCDKLSGKLKRKAFASFYIVNIVAFLLMVITTVADSPKNFYEAHSLPAQAISIKTRHNKHEGRWVKYRENGKNQEVFVTDLNTQVEQQVGKTKTRAVIKQFRLKPEWKKYQQRVPKRGTAAYLKITEYHPNKWIETE